MKFPVAELKRWFEIHRRPLPWRESPTPYRVWVSEVMLQQTQASVVEPYFERWMERFPSIEALAAATSGEVIKAWEGLGYYSRARNLHAAAAHLVAHHGGQLPPDLIGIKGIGPYTRGAIQSFAFHQKAAAVDGNVVRVLARFFAIEEEVCLPKTQAKIWEIAESLLPEEEPWVVVEGLIELGALVCKKAPLCSQCPLQQSCQAHLRGLDLPRKAARARVTHLVRHVGIIFCGKRVLVQKREEGEVMGGLYEFPFTEESEGLAESLGLPLVFKHALEEERHTFTRFRVRLIPRLYSVATADPRYEWVSCEELANLPFSSGHRRLLAQL